MRQAEKERKKILSPNSIHTQPGQENSEKDSKKIQKIKKPHSGIIFRQNGTRQAGKKRKLLVPNLVHTRPGLENSEKKSKKIQKIKKTPFRHYVQPKRGMRQAEKEKKKIQFRIPFTLDQGKKISKKIAKKFKIGRASCRERVC